MASGIAHFFSPFHSGTILLLAESLETT
jgi:hypothetical protein